MTVPHGTARLPVTVKVARSALRIPLALGEKSRGNGMVMAAATYILRGGADAMAVSLTRRVTVQVV
jgi:hypothetical protein